MHVRFSAGSHVSSCGSHSSFTLNITEAASSVVLVVCTVDITDAASSVVLVVCTGVSVVPSVVVAMVDVMLVAEVVVKVKAEIDVGSCVKVVAGGGEGVIVGGVLVAMAVVVVVTVVVVVVVTVVLVAVVVVAGQPPSPGKQSVALSHARPFSFVAIVTSQFLQCGDAINSENGKRKSAMDSSTRRTLLYRTYMLILNKSNKRRDPAASSSRNGVCSLC
jgi:hypothetical protein